MNRTRNSLHQALPVACLALLAWACSNLLGIEEGSYTPCESGGECVAAEGGAGGSLTAGSAGGQAGAPAVSSTSSSGASSTGRVGVNGSSTGSSSDAGGDAGSTSSSTDNTSTSSDGSSGTGGMGGTAGTAGVGPVEPECEAAETQCDEAGRQLACTGDGNWGEATDCPFLCVGDRCDGECEPDTVGCQDALTPKTCDEDGLWQVEAACDGVCDNGECSGSCSPGALQCAGTSLLECGEDGAWFTLEECDFLCNSTSLECSGECLPNSERCYQGALERCLGDGSWSQQETCAFECLESASVPGDFYCSQCVRDDQRCANSGGTAQTCDSSGNWMSETCPNECIGDVCVGCTDADGHCPNGCSYAFDNDCPKPNGTACSTAGECSSNLCVDGVCCNAACNGECSYCNLSDSMGTCTSLNFNSDPDNCGGCGDVCSSNHITRACSAGQCSGSCSGSWRDCNSDKLSDGCEIDTNSSPNHCGACGSACSSNHVTPACSAGMCSGSCTGTWGNCDNNLRSNGCETNTATNANHCGACGTACPYGVCQASECVSTKWGTNTSNTTSTRAGLNFTGMRITIGQDTQVVALALNTVTTGVGLRLGLYPDANNAPQALIVQTDELTTINGFTEGRVTPTNVTAGDYWLFLLAESNVTFRAITNQTNFWYRTDQPFGPLPTNVPALTGTMAPTLTGYVVTAP